ncbi:acetate--CoA ligase family protein [Arthrobacter sp. SLBN-53]|uniref:acetate--CoA ligase family protein n=1 Tax=Arthrobacter sp. SLBN-53 TaxID=2768412 RepID=UPI0011516B34|nr:acetate--CoA ligase family protein [Arthrobacter sp. SLBN-53]TQK30968.1 acyl-CoA synthetase (NDP forming) [Arthrobacter sp. SLBN-53]
MPEDSPRPGTGLTVFHDPASVAVVGASADPAKWGHWLARGALRGAARRDVYLVNASGRPVLDTETHASLGDLPAVPELVALCVPAAHVGAIVDEGLALGVRGFLGITAGVPDEAALAARVRASGARLIGMNSLGLYDAGTDLHLAWGDFAPGAIAVVSQSGQLGSEIAILAARAGLGISRFYSIGNQSDVRAVDVLADLVQDDTTRVVALYLESFAGGRDIVAALAALRSAGKHVLLLTVGASAASSRLARSHTGSLTSGTDIVDAAARAAAAVRVATPTELIDVARVLLSGMLPEGNRVAIVGDSGGQTGIAADVAAAAQLEIPELATDLQNELGHRLPAGAAVSNPVDLAGAGEQDLFSYAEVTELLLGSPDIDALVLTGYFGTYGADAASLVDRELQVCARLGDIAKRSGKPLVVHSMSTDTVAVDALSENGVPVYAGIDTALRALSHARRLHRNPRPLPAVTPSATTADLHPGYPGARDLLASAGIAFPAAEIVRSADDLPAACVRLSAPYVLKAGWLEHKSEMGGVRVGLATPQQLADAFAEMAGRLGAGDYVIEELDTRRDVVEVLVGARRDPDLGAVVVVGAGGTEAELYRDVALELAPVDTATAHDMLRRLQCAALLDGWRGKPAVDTAALADVVVAVSELAAARGDITEIEINPVRVAPTGALAVDALVISTTSDEKELVCEHPGR